MSTNRANNPYVLIVGQGLAGSALAWQLERRGVPFAVIDRGGVDPAGRPCASRVAAGLVTPITGKRLTLDPRWEELRASAAELYRFAEASLQTEIFHEKPSLRVLDSAEEREQLDRRLESAEYSRQITLADPAEIPATLNAQHGAFWMPGAARLDVRRFVETTRKWLAFTGRCIAGSLQPTDLQYAPNGIQADALDLSAGIAIFCQGAVPAEELPPGCPSVVADKGELLTIDSPDLQIDFTAHRGVWVSPQFAERVRSYLVGSTYGWGELDSEPTVAARESILSRLAELTDVGANVVEHAAAARPASKIRQPITGFSEREPRIGWYNGLGAKGVLWAPWHAAQLAGQCAAAFDSE